MFKECSAPMAAYEGGSEPVRLGGEMGGDEGKNLQRDAIYGNERVPPLADGCQRGRDIPVKLINLVEREAIERVSMLSSCKTLAGRASRQCFATYNGEYTLRFSSSFRAKTSCESDRPFPG